MPATEKSNRLAVDRLQTKRRRAEETVECAARLQSYIYTTRCSHHQSLRNCSSRLHSLPVSVIAVRVADIHTYIHIYIAKSRMEHNHWPRFARSRSPLGNYTLRMDMDYHMLYNYYLPYGWKFWRGIYFGGLAVLRAIHQYFIRQKLHTVMSSLLQTHSLCTI